MRRRDLLVGATAVLCVKPTLAGEPELPKEVLSADFIVIGERHDNPDHHRKQAELVAALKPRGIAFEMISQQEEERVNALRAAGTSSAEIGSAIGWEKSGWPDWAYYAPILGAVPEAYIAGGGLSKQQLGAIYAEGAAGLGSEMALRYGLNDPMDEDMREAMLEEQYLAHCEMMDRERLGPMVEVQRAWDVAYADAWLRASEKGGGRAVLICGNGHARLDRGAPSYLAKAVPGARIASIGLLEDGESPPESGVYSASFSYPKPEREDSCEKMRKAMQKG